MTSVQIAAILFLLQAFGVSPSVITTVQNILEPAPIVEHVQAPQVSSGVAAATAPAPCQETIGGSIVNGKDISVRYTNTCDIDPSTLWLYVGDKYGPILNGYNNNGSTCDLFDFKHTVSCTVFVDRAASTTLEVAGGNSTTTVAY